MVCGWWLVVGLVGYKFKKMAGVGDDGGSRSMIFDGGLVYGGIGWSGS